MSSREVGACSRVAAAGEQQDGCWTQVSAAVPCWSATQMPRDTLCPRLLQLKTGQRSCYLRGDNQAACTLH